ncbi:MAG: peptide chain release factor-like protein [Planctomycetota bacterium]
MNAKRDESQPDAASAAALRARLTYDDARLLGECDVHLHRTGGPGGQHRNKVASAVRLVHRPTGFVVTATERRSQHENRANAVQRLREAIAVGLRLPLPEQVVWPESVQIQARGPDAARVTLRVSARNPAVWQVLALALDALTACRGNIGDAAACLGVTTSSLTRFLHDHPRAWAEANRLRAAAGLPPLRS